jgi:hypothetical protein
MNGLTKRIFLAGPGDLNKTLLDNAYKIILARYPLAEVFSPTMLSPGLDHHAFEVICRSRIRGWATDFVYVDMGILTQETIEHRRMATEKELPQLAIRGGILEAL